MDKKPEELTKQDFFFCYSKPLSDYLKSKGHNYIVVGVNPLNKSIYSMYARSKYLDDSIADYQNKKNKS